MSTAVTTGFSIRTEVDTLSKALKLLLPFAQGKLPVHSGVRLTAADDQLVLEATNDGDQWVATSLAVAMNEPGRIVVPAKVLDAFLGKVHGAAELKLLGDDQLTISCGASSLDLMTIDGAQWPLFEEVEGEEFEFTPELWAGVGRVVYAQGRTEDKSPSRHAVHFDHGAVAATSGGRLAACEIPGLKAEANVPGTFVAAVNRVVGPKQSVFARFAERSASFRSGVTQWSTRLIADSYPNWRGAFRTESPTSLTVSRSDMLAALDKAGVLPESPGLKRVTLQRLGDDLVLTAQGPDIGKITDVIPCSGNFDSVIMMDVGELKETIDNSVEDELTFGAVDGYKAFQIEQGPWKAMVMPRKPMTPPADPAYATSGKNAGETTGD